MADNYKYKQMQDEMSRFEAEIAAEHTVKGSGGRQTGSGFSGSSGGLPPPPAPPINLLLPSPIQKSRVSAGLTDNLMPTPKPQPQTQSQPQPQSQSQQNATVSGAPQIYKAPKESMSAAEILSIVKDIEPSVPSSPMAPLLRAAAIESAAHNSSTYSYSAHRDYKSKKDKKNRKAVRTAGGQTWEDLSLLDWPDDDFRLFCGDLGNDVTDELLTRTFSKYSSFYKAKVIRDKRTNKSKGFGFVSFKEPGDFIKAMKEMNGRYVGSRPIKLRKSTWKARSLEIVRKKEKEKAQLISLLTGGPQK